MTVENYLAEAGALAGLAGILAGFSLAAVVQLLTSGNTGKLTTAGIVVFSAASVLFLYSLIVAVLSFSAAAELNRVPTELDNLNTGALLLLFAANIYLCRRCRHGRLDTLQGSGHSHNCFGADLHLPDYVRDREGPFAFYVRRFENQKTPSMEGVFSDFYLILNICINFIARFKSPASLILPCMKACIPSSSPVKILT